MSNPIESKPVLSVTYVCKAYDHRCRYWAKVVRSDTPLPLPEHVSGAKDIPGAYIRKGDDIELFEGDFLLEGEEVHHVKKRGWTYTLRTMMRAHSGIELRAGICTYGIESKTSIRKAGARELLGGSGDVAAMVREIHARRLGIIAMPKVA